MGSDLMILVLIIAGIGFIVYLYKLETGVKAKKTPEDDSWISEINTGFDEWFNDLKNR